MSGQLKEEIKQNRPFASLEHEASLNVFRTADFLQREVETLLKTFKLSCEQFNVLRILRGAGEFGMPCSEIGTRMISRRPDVTRLLDRLEVRGLAHRSRDMGDRRVVTCFITKAGLKILAELDKPVIDLARTQFSALDGAEVEVLIGLLERVRMRKPLRTSKQK